MEKLGAMQRSLGFYETRWGSPRSNQAEELRRTSQGDRHCFQIFGRHGFNMCVTRPSRGMLAGQSQAVPEV